MILLPGANHVWNPSESPTEAMWLWFDGGMTPQFCWDNRSRTFQVTYVHFSRHTQIYIYIYTRYIYIYITVYIYTWLIWDRFCMKSPVMGQN